MSDSRGIGSLWAAQVGCTVYLDGQRLADGNATDDLAAPVVLSGLSLTWGRSNTIDQPESSTLSFELIDPTRQLARGDLLQRKITVTASGVVYGVADQSVFENGGFTSGSAPLISMQDGQAIIVDDPHVNQYGLQLTGPAHGWWAQIWPKAAIAPRAFASQTQPDAWDDLPQARAGQTWHVEGYVRGAPDTHLVLGLAAFATPWDRNPRTMNVTEVIGTGEWQHLAGDYTVQAQDGGRWFGITCEIWGDTRRTWDLHADIDEGTAWATWDIAPDWSVIDWGRALFDDLSLLAPSEGVLREVNVTDGRISDVSVTATDWDPDGEGAEQETVPLLAVTVSDFATELASRRIGDQPWPAEPLSTRVERIETLSGGIPIDVADTVAGTEISWLDVDSQPPIDLLRDLAQTVDGVLWIQTHPAIGGPYLRLEDPAERTSGHILVWQDDTQLGGEVIIGTQPGAVGLPIGACDVLNNVEWVQNTQDTATRVSVRWLEEIQGEDGTSTTEHTVNVIDDDLEAQRGINGVSVGTLLTDSESAQTLALRMLNRLHIDAWRASGVELLEDTIEDPAAVVGTLIGLLDSSARSGRNIDLTGLPDWGPVGPDTPMFLEGGSYSFTGGQWDLSLNLSNTLGLGISVRLWEFDPAWMVWNIHPSIATADLSGTGPPGTADPLPVPVP